MTIQHFDQVQWSKIQSPETAVMQLFELWRRC